MTTNTLKKIESNSIVDKNKKWKQIFDKGKAEGLFKSYSSSHNLKTSLSFTKTKKTIKYFILKTNATVL